MNLAEFKIRQLQRRVMDQKKPVVLEVKKITSDTRANGTNYTGEQFVLLDIYLKTNGTVKVTYGDLTKTITDTSGAEEPNAQQVFFGTFNGVSDSVETPASGTLTIEGGYTAFGSGSFSYYNSISKAEGTKYYSGITSVVDFGDIKYIPDYAFYGNTNLSITELPDNITKIGAYAFYQNSSLKLSKLPSKIKSIGGWAFYHCNRISFTEIPEGVETIGDSSFYMGTSTDGREPLTVLAYGTMRLPSTLKSIGASVFVFSQSGGSSPQNVCYLSKIEILATTPPSLGTGAFGTDGAYVVVPVGCGEAYRASTGWSDYTIAEASE